MQKKIPCENAVAKKLSHPSTTYNALTIQTLPKFLSMCKNDGTPAAMESGKGDTTMATFVHYILRGGNEVWDTSYKAYDASDHGPHALKSPRYVSNELRS